MDKSGVNSEPRHRLCRTPAIPALPWYTGGWALFHLPIRPIRVDIGQKVPLHRQRKRNTFKKDRPLHQGGYVCAHIPEKKSSRQFFVGQLAHFKLASCFLNSLFKPTDQKETGIFPFLLYFGGKARFSPHCFELGNWSSANRAEGASPPCFKLRSHSFGQQK